MPFESDINAKKAIDAETTNEKLNYIAKAISSLASAIKSLEGEIRALRNSLPPR
jgi:hypothetical protein